MKTKLQNRCSVGVLKSCRSKVAYFYLNTIILFLLYFVESTYTLFPPAYMFKVIQDKSRLQSVRYYRMERILFVFEFSWATRGNITHSLHELGLLFVDVCTVSITALLGRGNASVEKKQNTVSLHFIAAAVRHN